MFIQPDLNFPQILVVLPPNDLLSFSADALVNTINCKGVMGAGVAKKFKLKYPEMFKKYQVLCGADIIKPGKIWPHTVLPKYETPPKLILNMATKDHWKDNSRYEWIEAGLKSLVECIKIFYIPSLAMPKIGCGNGGLDWNIVKDMIFRELEEISKDCKIYILE